MCLGDEQNGRNASVWNTDDGTARIYINKNKLKIMLQSGVLLSGPTVVDLNARCPTLGHSCTNGKLWNRVTDCARVRFLHTGSKYLVKHILLLHLSPSKRIIIIIYPITARVFGAPQMILHPVSSILPCSPPPSVTWRTPGLSIP